MPQVPAAASAQDFRAEYRTSRPTGDDRLRQCPIEAWPAGAAFELGRGGKQRVGAAGAQIAAAASLLVEWARERPLGPRLAQDAVTLGPKLPAPIRVRLGDREARRRGIARPA